VRTITGVNAAIFLLAYVGTDAYELLQTFVFDDNADREDIDSVRTALRLRGQ